MCMCFAWGGVGEGVDEWMRGMGLGFTNHVGTGGSVGRVFGLQWCGWCGWRMGRGLDQGMEGVVVFFLCEL